MDILNENSLYGLGKNIINHKVKNKNGAEGIVVDYNDEKNQIEVCYKECSLKYIYPVCFEKGYLSFVCEEDMELIAPDLQVLKENDKDFIEKNKANADRMALIKQLSEHLSCVKKYNSVKDFCDDYKNAINQEIDYMENQGRRKYKITNGTKVANIGSRCVYLYETEDELSFLPNSPIRIYYNNDFYKNGEVISCEDNTLMFSGNSLESCYLKEVKISFDASFIMKDLNKRLDDLKDRNNPIVDRLICSDTRTADNSELQFGQDKAVEMACTRAITYIWGPPGTGKTYTIASIVKKILSKNKRVLMLSYSNVSVDGAVLEVAKQCENCPTGEIIRYGYPKNKELLNSENMLTSYNVALKLNHKLKVKRDELLKKKEIIGKINIKYKQIQDELNSISAKIKSDKEIIVKNAKFIATTLSKSVCDKLIFDQSFDAVIIDEASMAYTPQIICAANLANSHFCCVGDFNQLPPIVQSDRGKKDNDSENALKTDIFEYCGDLNNMAILFEQRRMHEDIATFISANMYFRLLKSHETIKERELITKCEPFKDMPITYVDIHGLVSTTKLIGTSHINVISALVSLMIAEKALMNSELDVGIITPYKEQEKLINLILLSTFADEYKKRAVCSTVHQFQGSQRDIIVYDATDAGGEIIYPGALLASNKHNYSNRLFNVAMTRAKGKFIVVADREFVDGGLTKGKRENVKKSLFYSLSRYSQFLNLIVDGKKIECSNAYDIEKQFISYNSKKNFKKLYVEDLKSLKKRVYFYVPYKMNSDQKHFLSMVEKKNGKANVSINNKYKIKDGNEKTSDKDRKPFDMTVIDEEIVWINPLKKNSLCWRIKSKRVAEKLVGLI